MSARPTGARVRVLVVEDSRAQRELLIGLIQATAGFELAGAVGNGQEAIAAFRHAVILDPQFVPGILGMGRAYAALGNGVQAQRCYRNALKQLSRIHPATPLPELDGATAGEVALHIERQLPGQV